MGLIKLALLGGAGFYAVKKLNENKDGKRNGCRGHCQRPEQQEGPYNAQSRDMSEQVNSRAPGDHKQQYYDFEPDYSSQKRQATVSEKQLPSYPQQQQQMSYPVEKQEYQRNY